MAILTQQHSLLHPYSQVTCTSCFHCPALATRLRVMPTRIPTRFVQTFPNRQNLAAIETANRDTQSGRLSGLSRVPAAGRPRSELR